MRDSPCVLAEVMDSSPEMEENCFSKGVATAEAMVSGLPPERDARTSMVGKSTFGRWLTGRLE
jgi:hypothetical protein